MPGRVPVSVTVITLDEERNLARCLASVAWADEIVVVDAGSVDRTGAIAARFGARVVPNPWPGYAGQKNRAAAAARNDWILSLDADEWLEPGAAQEIAVAVAQARHAAYAFRRLSAFSGAFLPHTWSPDLQIRLYRRDAARFAGGRVHESVQVDLPGTIGRLGATLCHLTHRSVREQVDRLNRYSDLASASAVEAGRRSSLARMVVGPAAAFVKMYVLKRGFLDGVRGLIAAVDHAHYVFLKSAKLWDRTRPRDPEFSRRVEPTDDDPDPGAPYSG
jgi:glycosyltransferase involved in cell wall biosynthesis